MGEKRSRRATVKRLIRLHITGEGQTEERFVKDTLAMYLGLFQIATDIRRVLTSRDRRHHKSYRGGLINYEKAKKDILTWVKEDRQPESYFTTMFDLYALPDNFPAYEASKAIADPYERIRILENAFQEDIDHPRFIPYIQLHEFEALVLANPANLEAEYFQHQEAIAALQNDLVEVGGNPELINDNPATAPSKRILAVIPEYDKVSVGATIAGINGIDFLKKKCRHFSEWVEKLEKLADDAI
jgi:hypothetical protein